MLLNSEPVKLTEGQKSAFYLEVDQFGEKLDAADDPQVRLLGGFLLKGLRENPEDSVGMLIYIGNEIRGIVSRIHDASLSHETGELS